MLKNFVAKKTKKEKLLAEKRRLLALVNERKIISQKQDTSQTTERKSTFVFQSPPETQIPDSQSGQSKDSYAYVAADLKKIVVLTAFAICAQVVLWYLL